MSLLSISPVVFDAIKPASLDDLWQEAETLGNLRIWTHTDYRTGERTSYAVTISGRRRNTEMEIKRSHTSLHCALADAINEAREMGLGEPG